MTKKVGKTIENAVCKVGDADSPGIPLPPTVPKNRVGFSDVVVDSSGIVRRSLLVYTNLM